MSRRYSVTGPAKLRSSFTAILAPERLTLKIVSALRARVNEQRTEESLGERLKASLSVCITAGHGPLDEAAEYPSIRRIVTMCLALKVSTQPSAICQSVGGIMVHGASC